jgi:ABC-type sulfate transport system permease subunit
VTANHPTGVMWGRARIVSVDNGAMTLEAAVPLVAVSVLVWVMIVLPIVLLLGVAVAWLVNRGRSGA